MAVPKRRKSRCRIKQRHGSHKRPVVSRATCEKCGAARQPHRVCPGCGSYAGRQVVTVAAEG